MPSFNLYKKLSSRIIAIWDKSKYNYKIFKYFTSDIATKTLHRKALKNRKQK